jgi:hypothetical protein
VTSDGPSSDDRALLTVTAWPHDGELVAVVRWRPSLAAGAEVVSSARGLHEVVALVADQLGELDLGGDG